MPYLIKLKTVLQSKYLYLFLGIFLTIYILVTTIFIKYETKIDSNVIEGIITSVSKSDDSLSFILKSSEKIKCTYYLNEEDNSNYNNLLGKKVRIIGTIKEAYNNTIPNTFNYKKYLYNNKIYITFNVDSIEILNNENIFYKIKNIITNKMNNYEDIVKVYLNLFILGNKDLLDENTYNNYRTNGIWHLFAISGTHINLIILILDKLLKKIKFKKTIISLILFYFMFLTGFSASVQRTSIFYFLKSFLNYIGIDLDNIKILILSAVIILIINPFMIYNVGFQYSFLITLIIMLESKYITGSYLKKIFKISLISFIVSMPITINMNYEINLLSIFLNMFYVPFISFVIFPISIVSYLLPFLSFILKIHIYILEFTNEIFYDIKLSLVIPKIPTIIIIIYYLILYFYHRYRRRKYLIFILIILFINIFIPKLDRNFYAYYLDVGQGDSSILISPYKKEVIMIDTGGNFNSNYQVTDNTITFLKSLGINKIDCLIITHGDYDHMGEAINLVNNYKIDEVIFNNDEYNDLELGLIKVLKQKNIPYFKNIKELNISDKKLYFLNDDLYGNENDNSNVIYTELNNYKLLFMGDAGVEVEEDLIKKYNLQDINVLKVGHHGSKTSSSKFFINEINPKYSIISVGKNNRYGHPNESVLDNLEASKIYRTDMNGSIIFKIKNNKLDIETYIP